MEFTELKNKIVAWAKENSACAPEFKRLIAAETEAALLQVLKDNWNWTWNDGAMTPELFAGFSSETQKEVGAFCFTEGFHEIRGNSQATLGGNSQATLRGNSQATLWGNSQATLWENSQATLRGNSQATLRGNSQATLWENSQATLWGNSQATLWGNSQATLRGKSQATLRDNSRAIGSEKTSILSWSYGEVKVSEWSICRHVENGEVVRVQFGEKLAELLEKK